MLNDSLYVCTVHLCNIYDFQVLSLTASMQSLLSMNSRVFSPAEVHHRVES